MKGYSNLKKWSYILLLALAVTSGHAEVAPELQEPGVIYFEGNLPDTISATLAATTTVYVRRDFQMALATLYSGQKIELIGMSTEGYLLKTNYRNNTVTGWIKPGDLPAEVDPGLFATAKKNQARHDAVAAAIASKIVIQGMTTDEVKQSVGRPEQIASHTDTNGTATTWTYTTYQEIPQYSYALNQFGRAVQQVYYVKVPVGQLTVTFNNGAVISIEQHKTDPNSPGVVTN